MMSREESTRQMIAGLQKSIEEGGFNNLAQECAALATCIAGMESLERSGGMPASSFPYTLDEIRAMLKASEAKCVRSIIEGEIWARVADLSRGEEDLLLEAERKWGKTSPAFVAARDELGLRFHQVRWPGL